MLKKHIDIFSEGLSKCLFPEGFSLKEIKTFINLKKIYLYVSEATCDILFIMTSPYFGKEGQNDEENEFLERGSSKRGIPKS